MFNLKTKLGEFFKTLIPTQTRTIYDPRQQPPTIATSLDVDRVHEIFQEAQVGSVRDLFALYRDILMSDNHMQTEFGSRKLAVLGDVLTVQPADKTNPDDVKASADVQTAIGDIPGWLDACAYLLHSTLWPVSILEKVFSSTVDGYQIARLVPVPYELLDYSMGYLRIWDTDPRMGTMLGTAQIPTDERYIIHRGHLLPTADNWGGPMRSIVFWWLLGAMGRDWWSRFLDRYGSPFVVGKYEQGDDASRSVLERAFQYAVKIGGLVVSKETQVELIQAAAGNSGEAYEKFLGICQREKSKLILGQASTETRATGLGSGVSAQQEGVRQDIRQYDAQKLGNTLRDQLFSQWLRINGISGRIKLVWGGESTEERKATGDLLKNLHDSGLELTDDGITALSERLGFSLRRASTPSPARAGVAPLSIAALASTADAELAVNDVAHLGAADLARAFRGSLAPVRRLIALSTSPSDLEAKLRAFYPDYSSDRQARLLEEALLAYTANGSSGGVAVTH